MYKRRAVFFLLFVLLVSGLLDFNYFLAGQEMDQTDPVKLANYVLKLILVGDVDGLRAIMHPDQKETYTPFTIERREQLQQQVANDREKIEKVLEISEIRELTNFNDKPSVAARIRKKSGEVYVIVLTKDENLYYFETLLTLEAKAYKKLKLFKKPK
jgi:hypothetical protein